MKLADDSEAGEPGPGPRYAVPAVAKAMEVITLLAGEAEGLSMSEIAQRLDRSMGEIYRIVLELERQGYLLKDEATDRRALSLKLFELAHQHPPTERLIRLAQPILDRLAGEIDQSCHLGVLSGDQLLVVAKADNPLPMHYSVKLGARFPALETSSGVVLWAYRRPEERASIMAGVAAADRPALEGRFAAVRAASGERQPSAVVAGIVNLSAPVFDRSGRVLATMTVPFLAQLRQRADLDDAQRRLVLAAADLSRALGARSDPNSAFKEPA